MSGSKYLEFSQPGALQILLKRIFDAPRARVFEALTRPDLLKRWVVRSPGWSLVSCEVELEVGGAYRFIWLGPGNVIMGMHGVYREILPPERLVSIEFFDDDWPGGELVTTLSLSGTGSRTALAQKVYYPTRESRDAAVDCGLEHSMAASYSLLDDLLAFSQGYGAVRAARHAS
jgi:uncharacterized protein YndB with AHSA1/START domain